MDRLEKSPKEVVSAELQKNLLLLEEQEGSVNFKFGVLYAKAGQICDDDMFSNGIRFTNSRSITNNNKTLANSMHM